MISRPFKEQEEYVLSLSIPNQKAIHLYTTERFKIINQKLINDDKLYGEYNDIVERLDTIIDGSPPIEEWITVYRGIDNVFTFSQKVKSFTSTSSDKEEAKGFTGKDTGCCLLEIKLPPGSKVIPVSMWSQHPGENEILLGRDSEFILLGRDDRTKDYQLIHIPSAGLNLDEQVTEQDIQSRLSEEEWVSRIFDKAKEEIEDFDSNATDAVNDVIKLFYPNETISDDVKRIAINRLVSVGATK